MRLKQLPYGDTLGELICIHRAGRHEHKIKKDTIEVGFCQASVHPA